MIKMTEMIEAETIEIDQQLAKETKEIGHSNDKDQVLCDVFDGRNLC